MEVLGLLIVDGVDVRSTTVIHIFLLGASFTDQRGKSEGGKQIPGTKQTIESKNVG